MRRVAMFSLIMVAFLAGATDAAAFNPRMQNWDLACVAQGDLFRFFAHGQIEVVLHYGACPAATPANDDDNDGIVDGHTCDTLGGNILAVTDAMMDVHDVFNSLVGVDLDISLTTTTAPFTFGDAEGDTSPTLHVGFMVDEHYIDGGAAVVTPSPSSGCSYTEQHMVVRDPSLASWTWNEPTDDGVEWYLAGQYTPARSFRTVYTHELLHALGFAHEDDDYSMLNNNDRPYFNESPGSMVQPLPDDITALRYAYPAAGDSTQLRLTNTWVWSGFVFPPTCDVTTAMPQMFNCLPSLGVANADRYTDNGSTGTCAKRDPDGIPTCGVNVNGGPGSTSVTPCDDLRMAVTIANTGTRDLDLDIELWFSVDDVWDIGDVPSTTVRHSTVQAGDSVNRRRMFEVPELPDGTYFVIARVAGTPVGGAGRATRDWIPLRGTVDVTQCCPTCPRAWTVGEQLFAEQDWTPGIHVPELPDDLPMP